MWNQYWNLRVSDRLTQWKNFRHKISDMPLDLAINEVNSLWSTAPFVTYYLAADNPESWPDPWELLAENYYCDVAKALGMLYTIYFTSHKDTDLEIRICYDYETKDRHNLVYVKQGKYILNYWPHEIVNKEQVEKKSLQTLYRYSSSDLQLEKY